MGEINLGELAWAGKLNGLEAYLSPLQHCNLSRGHGLRRRNDAAIARDHRPLPPVVLNNSAAGLECWSALRNLACVQRHRARPRSEVEMPAATGAWLRARFGHSSRSLMMTHSRK